MNKIHIDINIPFYLYNCIHRIKLTEKIFQHYIDIKNKFIDKAIITFTLIGSEKELSKNLALKYFNEDEYFEFDQEPYNINYSITYHINLLNMLTSKFRYSFKQSMNKNPNVSLLSGSNDYISYNFFEQIIDSYNPNEKMIYGVDNYYNGENAILYVNYDGINNKFTDKSVWIDGVHLHREKYKYCGGIIGFNDNLFNNYYNELMNKIITYDEGFIEFETLKLSNVIKFNSKEVFFINIKTISTSEITSYDHLNNNCYKVKLLFDNFNTKFKENFNYEFNNLK